LAVMRAGRLVQHGDIGEVWRHPVDEATALFLGYARVLHGPAADRVLAAAGRPVAAGAATAVAVRRSALQLAAPGQPGAQAGAQEGALAATVRSLRGTPEQLRLVLDVDGVGEVDAVAGLDHRMAPGDRVGVVVDATRLAVLPGARGGREA
ncbi:MAG: hypothetical protein ABN473_13235, partial [Nocardioides kribbensis]